MNNPDEKCLTLDTLNPNIIIMQYAVRGPLVTRALQLAKELEKGVKKPFNEVIRANIGDCHAMGQEPITFVRQVLALVSYPQLLNSPDFPDDAKERAIVILQNCKGYSVGAYTESAGMEIIRRHIAAYIEKRDGISSNYEDIILSTGASQGIRNILRLLVANVNDKKPGVMVPIPQYPLYSATLAEFGMHQICYYLDEERNWGLDIMELKRAVDEARTVCHPRAIVVINPGNPTGQVLTRNNIEQIIRFAFEEKLFIFADEVYQYNVYAEDCAFHSFKKVMSEMELQLRNLELASFMSASKGYLGECGLRGGCTEVVNLDPEVKAMLLKNISAHLCPATLGQTAVDIMVTTPKPGEPSYELFMKEKNGILRSLAERAKIVADTFNSIRGVSCNPVQGAMYAFPQIKLPEKAIETAAEKGQAPDVFYAFQLLENAGICVVPGSGFGQKEGTFHFRTTILPQPNKLKEMLGKFCDFHEKFLKQYE